jgi:hypothetical protein
VNEFAMSATTSASAATSVSLAVVLPAPEPAQTWVSAGCVPLAAVSYLTWGTVRGDLTDRRWLAA